MLIPPQKGNVDSWLTRIVPEKIEKLKIHYGYTNWIGLPQEDKAVRNKYLILIRRAPGFNLEENWGFSKLYDARYKYPEAPFYQSLFTIAVGAKGFNVYTGASTSHWDAGLDNQHEIPYPADAPITEEGELTDKYKALKLIGAFFKDHGKDFLESELDVFLSWGLYLPYARACALGDKKVRCGQALLEFAGGLYENNLDFDVLNLRATAQKTINARKNIVIAGAEFMDERTQRKLADFVKAGGNLWMSGQVPSVNEKFESCNILTNCFKKYKGKNFVFVPKNKELLKVIIEKCKPLNKIKSVHKNLRIFLYQHRAKNTQFIFIFNEAAREKFVKFKVCGKPLSLNMAKKSTAVIKIENGIFSTLLIKNINEFYKSKIRPGLIFNKQIFKLDEAVDVYAIKEK